jgi:hypothetical protein
MYLSQLYSFGLSFTILILILVRYSERCVEFDPSKKCQLSDLECNGLEDGLDLQVNALPYSITERYGEIVFAQGGTGYGWWPCQIYDPRQAFDPTVRQMAQKHLHSRHLVYFFNCTNMNHDGSNTKGGAAHPSHGTKVNHTSNTSATGTVNPFSILPPKMIKSWIVGLSEDLYFGRAAKNHGKQRYRSFRDAFQLACIEYDKSANNTRADQQRKFMLDKYVYPKMDTTTSTVVSSTAVPSASIQRDSFLVPSTTNVGTSNQIDSDNITVNKEDAIDLKKTTTKKKQQQRYGDDKVDWIRVPGTSRKRSRSASTQLPTTDDQPHPAIADLSELYYSVVGESLPSAPIDYSSTSKNFSSVRNDIETLTHGPIHNTEQEREAELSSIQIASKDDHRLNQTKRPRGRPKKIISSYGQM